MSLILEERMQTFNLESVKKGYLIFAQHKTWKEGGKSGIVTNCNKKEITLQYYPGIGNIINHLTIPVQEVVKGEWRLRWSETLEQIETEDWGIDSI